MPPQESVQISFKGSLEAPKQNCREENLGGRRWATDTHF